MNLVNYRLENSYNVCVYPNDSAVNKVWQFPDIPLLRDRKTVALQLKLSSNDVSTNKSNLAGLVVGNTQPCFITLVDTNGNQFIQNLPVAELNTTLYQSSTSTTTAIGLLRNTNGIFSIYPKFVAWSKCFIQFPIATGLSNYCLIFNIYYI